MSGSNISPRPERSYFIIFSVLLIWVVIVAMIGLDLSKRPYFGAKFDTDLGEKVIVVTEVYEGGAAENAGLTIGTRITHLSTDTVPKFALNGLETVGGRHELRNYAMVQDTVDAKYKIWPLLFDPSLTFYSDDGTAFAIPPTIGRSLWSLPLKSYLTLTQSLLVLSITIGIVAFATPSRTVSYLTAGGFGLATNVICGAYLGSSLLTIPPEYFRGIINVAAWGFTIFSYSLLALFFSFPARLFKWPASEILFATGLALQAMVSFELLETPFHSFQIVNLTPIPFALIGSMLQWRQSRNDPIARASVMWFSLSIYGIVSAVSLLYSLPILLGILPIMSPHVVNFSLAFIYLGISAGALKYRLFDMHTVWWKTVTWLMGGFIVVIADLFLVWQFSIDQNEALFLALLLAGWVYFPIRQYIVQRFLPSQETAIHSLVPDLVSSFSSLRDNDQIEGRYISFLQRCFGADGIGSITSEVTTSAQIENNGLAMRVSNVAGDRSIQLVGKEHGRSLFSSNDVETVDVILNLIRSMKDTNQSLDAQQEHERNRIVRDLHDDVGGRLLSLVYQAGDSALASEARSTLAALKETLVVVENTETIDLDIAWREICTSASHRFAQSGQTFAVSEHRLAPRVLSAREYVNLKRVMFEIVSNAIKYGARDSIVFAARSLADGALEITASNTVKTQSEDPEGSHRGLLNIKTRIGELGGSSNTEFRKTPLGEDQFVVTIIIPL
ncbi:sensor histidine kinase [Sulfitobacter donghicola]|uniref:Uncharacterized protein n=1 Tax=Sulfitobacter donghicola DSW-25 = KCTC 12864 = JCM 14565 TaxID=1300350 RepID=A0A073IFT1_9RHOB|nr:histidine kinase [Sulfitobacter donghicola]KEJ88589.1 hypothetical protein DSW25_15630 [Sulfitobacter donghicola DSW-25 = KCTC 12864 = JCM 14565]KIN69605.1 putative two component sensor histidine kinase transcription regulator protein [Sulfitobacter donghicola DSW-25 = KCTC 12864 = JCM 14565]